MKSTTCARPTGCSWTAKSSPSTSPKPPTLLDTTSSLISLVRNIPRCLVSRTCPSQTAQADQFTKTTASPFQLQSTGALLENAIPSSNKDPAVQAGPLPPPLQWSQHTLSSIKLSLNSLSNNWFPAQAPMETMAAEVDGTIMHGITLLSPHSTQMLNTHTLTPFPELPIHASMLLGQAHTTIKPRPTSLPTQVQS